MVLLSMPKETRSLGRFHPMNMGVIAIIFSLMTYFVGGAVSFRDAILTSILGTTVIISGLAAITYSGLCLNRRPKVIPSSSGPKAVSIEQSSPRRRRADLAWVVATLLLAATSSIGLALFDALNDKLETELSELVLYCELKMVTCNAAKSDHFA